MIILTMTKLKEQIILLRKSGMTYNQISKKLGCSKSTISYHLVEDVRINTNKRRSRSSEVNKVAFQKYKEESGCFDCKNKYPHYMLDFDHKPEFEKAGGIYSVLKTKGIKAAWEEVEKCDVVCVSCHRIRTWTRNPW